VTEPLLEGTGLVKRFGDRTAVAGVDITVEEDECVAVLGPNGAGKSTLLRMAATLMRPDAGTLRVCGHVCPDDAGAARGRIGLLGHEPMVYQDLTAQQNLEFYADLHGLPAPRASALEGLEGVGLLMRANDPVRTFSRGMAQRLGLARVLMHDPDLLLLDEPHAGLDAPGGALLDDLLARRRPGRGVLLVTHEVERGVMLADRVMVLRAGRCVLSEPASDDPRVFRRRYEGLIA